MAWHEHFCWRCYMRRIAKQGWWRCNDKKCTRAMKCECKTHEEGN